MDILEKRKISFPCRDWNPIFQPLYRVHYHGCYIQIS